MLNNIQHMSIIIIYHDYKDILIVKFYQFLVFTFYIL